MRFYMGTASGKCEIKKLKKIIMGYYAGPPPALVPPGGTLSWCVSNYQTFARYNARTYFCRVNQFLH